jgi:hypothetical protein
MGKSVSGFVGFLAATTVSFSLATGAAIGMKSALAASTEVANPTVPTQTSSVSEVTIKVTPRNLASTADNWEFTIVLDTHSQDLSEDLLKSARLLDGVGGQQ